MDNKETIDSKAIEENFVKWSIPRPTQDYMVVVHCSTYNHGKYIEDALKGFVMQKTDFPFCAIVIDDGSTDDAPIIIRRYAESYPEIIKPILLGENHMQHGKSRNPYFDEWHNAAKYIAFCEGDDYWIDPLKLQKQVDFLEGHEECSMCFHSANIKNEIDAPIGLVCQSIEDRCYSANELFERWIVPTASIVFRASVLDYPIKHPENILNGDIILVEKCAHRGMVFGMKEKMSVYRIQSQGVTYMDSLRDERTKRYPNHYKVIKESFPLIDKKNINSTIAVAYFGKGSIEKSFVLKCFDYVIGLFYSPKAFAFKIKRIIGKRLKKGELR